MTGIEIAVERVYELNGELEQLRQRITELEKDAARYQWIKDATGETPLRPAAYNSEFPDTRLRFDFPTIISYDAVGNVTTLDAAIDAAMQKESGE